MSTLNDFVAAVTSQGLMPANRFRVEFGLPATLINATAGSTYRPDLRKVLMYCDSVQLPGLNISTTQARTFGELREMPYERLFDNVNMTFYIDTVMDTKALFDSWINSIQNPATRHMAYYNEYITDMTIYVLDKADDVQYEVTLYECYPKSIGAIQMDYSSKDVMKLQVSMNYRYWVSSSTVEDTANGEIESGREILESDLSFGALDEDNLDGESYPDLDYNSINTFRR